MAAVIFVIAQALSARPIRLPGPVKTPGSAILTVVNSGLPIAQRLRAVADLSHSLSALEINWLKKFLTDRIDPMEKNPEGCHALKNAVMVALEDQQKPAPDLTQTLIAIFKNKDQDPVTRDYALQHLVFCYQTIVSDSAVTREQIRLTLKKALKENSVLAGTALLGLHRICPTDGLETDKAIDRVALDFSSSPSVDVRTRITAVQVCGERRILESLPMIENLVETPQPTALRISAIAALGRLGGAADIALLRNVASDSNPSIHSAAGVALARLRPAISNDKFYLTGEKP